MRWLWTTSTLMSQRSLAVRWWNVRESRNDKSMLYDLVAALLWLEAHREANTAPVWASKTMTRPIYPPQGGFSEVWHIKLSPAIKQLLAQFIHEGRWAHSLYVFQSCCILFDIINMDQGVVCSSPTHSAPKGNISLDNTDMINADFYVWHVHVQYHTSQRSAGFGRHWKF